MKDVMLDFETLGTGTNAVVVQIGACYFDRETGEIGNVFKLNLDIKDALLSGGKVDGETISWWMGESAQARNSVFLNPEAPRMGTAQAFHQLGNFINRAERIWSHATFDFPILTETMRRLGQPLTFSHKISRDLRTLFDLAGIDEKNFARTGIHHDALDDCKFQVKVAVAALKKLKRADSSEKANSVCASYCTCSKCV